MDGLPAIFCEAAYGVFKEELLSLHEGKTTFESEAVNRTFSGEIKHVLIRYTVVPGYEETLSKVLISVVDITAPKKTEKALRESEAKYRRLSEKFARSCLSVYDDADGSFSYPYINQTVEDIFGVAPKDAMEDPSKLLAIIHPEDQQSFRQTVIESAATLSEYHEIIRCLKDDSIVWIEAYSVPKQQSDGSIVWDGFFIDITSRKRAEVALQVSEAEKQSILDNSPIAIWCFDGEEYSYLSKEWYRFTGQDSALPLTVDRWMERVHPDDLEKSSKIWEKHWNSKTAHYNDFRLMGKDGEYRYIHCLAVPVLDDDGCFLHFQGFNIDVTEQKKAEDTLRESEAKYRFLVEHLPQNIFIKDLDSVYISCNRHYAKNLNIMPEEIVGRTDYDFHPKELADKYRDDDLRVMSSGETEILEEHHVLGGKQTWVNTIKTPVRDSNGEIQGILGIFIDITDQKKTHQALKESEEKFRSLVDQAAEMLFLHDLKGNLVDVNLAAVANTGYTREALKKMNVFDIDPDAHDRNDMENYWKSLNPQDPPVTFEVRHKRKDGSTYPAEVVSSKIVFQDSHYILGLARDITERKQAEAERRKSEEIYRNLLNNLDAGVVVHAPDTSIMISNQSACRIMGLSEDQMIGKEAIDPQWKFLHEDGREYAD